MVAIIGILAAIVLVSLNSARGRARLGSLQATLASTTTLAALCTNDGSSVSTPTSATVGGGDICDDTSITAEVWPSLQSQSLGGSNSPYSYTTTSDTTVSSSDSAGVAVTCTVATGSCIRN